MTDEACRWPLPELSEPGQVSRADADEKFPVLEQDFDADSLYALRAAVAAHASQAGLSEGRTGDLVLAVHELAANAIRHGAGFGRVRLWHTRDGVRCEIADEGTPGPHTRDAAQWDIQPGHGLWLIRQVADQASLESGPSGTVAAVSFQLSPDGQPDSFGLAQRFADGYVVMTLTGQLALGSADQFAGAVGDLVRATPGLRLILDLSGLTLWDSSGLGALITAQRWIDADPAARMVLAALPSHLVQRLRDAGHAARFTLAANTVLASRMVR
jgi:anti-sigma regulatory factor (Ser/Thr protein kinase)/anti-anti-sigma regulatory factor